MSDINITRISDNKSDALYNVYVNGKLALSASTMDEVMDFLASDGV